MEREKLRRSRRGLILGVCQGLSNWSGLSVGLIRILALIALFSSGVFPGAFIYLLLAIILPPDEKF